MTPNQRDVFLYSWAQRRRRGRGGNALLCAAIGAAGGVLFALVLSGGNGGPLASGQASPGFPALLAAAGDALLLFALSMAGFGALGASLGDRVYRINEAMFQGMLAQGAAVPPHRPVLQASERGPQIAVAIAALLIGGGIVALWVALG